jgi:hypothetical protein
MTQIVLVIGLLAQQADAPDAGTGSLEAVRAEYQLEAEKYAFFADS